MSDTQPNARQETKEITAAPRTEPSLRQLVYKHSRTTCNFFESLQPHKYRSRWFLGYVYAIPIECHTALEMASLRYSLTWLSTPISLRSRRVSPKSCSQRPYKLLRIKHLKGLGTTDQWKSWAHASYFRSCASKVMFWIAIRFGVITYLTQYSAWTGLSRYRMAHGVHF